MPTENNVSAEELKSLGKELKKQNKVANEELVKRSSKALAVTGKIGADIKESTTKGIKGIGEKAKKTITSVPDMAMAGLDPSTQMIFGTIRNVVTSSFGYVKSLGDTIKERDQDAEDQREGTIEKLEETSNEQKDSILTVKESVDDGFGRLLAFMQGESLEDYERRREEAVRQKQLLNAVKDAGQPDVTEDKDSSGFLFFSGLMKALAALLIKVLTPIASSIGAIGGLFLAAKDQIQLIVRVFRGIAASVSSVGKLFSTEFALRETAGTFTDVIGVFRNVVRGVRAAFTTLSSGINAVLSPVRAAAETVRGLFVPMEGVSRGFQAVRGFLSPLGKIIGNVARVVRLIFAPLRIILIGFETLRGALDGFKEDGIIGGIQGAITGFFNGLIGIPADLIMNTLAWVIDRMGFSNAAAVLREFSWADLISDLVALPFNLLRGAFGWIKNQLGFNEGQMPSIIDIIIGIYTAPATLVRNAAHWLLGKFGFDDDMIPDPKDILMDIIMAPFRILENVRDWIADKVSGLGTIVSRLIPSPLKNLLGINRDTESEETDEDTVAKKLPQRVKEVAEVSKELLSGTAESIGQTASNIRDSVGGFVGGLFGRDSDNDDVVSQQNEIGAARISQTSDEFSDLQAQRDQLEMEQSRAGRGDGGSNIFAPTNVSTSSTQVIKRLPQVASRPPSAHDLIFGA